MCKTRDQIIQALHPFTRAVVRIFPSKEFVGFAGYHALDTRETVEAVFVFKCPQHGVVANVASGNELKPTILCPVKGCRQRSRTLTKRHKERLRKK